MLRDYCLKAERKVAQNNEFAWMLRSFQKSVLIGVVVFLYSNQMALHKNQWAFSLAVHVAGNATLLVFSPLSSLSLTTIRSASKFTFSLLSIMFSFHPDLSFLHQRLSAFNQIT